MDYCQSCGLPVQLGRHNLNFLHDKEKCEECSQETTATCVAGIGHFVFRCSKCGHVWDNLHQLFVKKAS